MKKDKLIQVKNLKTFFYKAIDIFYAPPLICKETYVRGNFQDTPHVSYGSSQYIWKPLFVEWF